MTNLIHAAGRDQLKRSDIELDIENCLIQPCGGCSEAGIEFSLSLCFRNIKDKQCPGTA